MLRGKRDIKFDINKYISQSEGYFNFKITKIVLHEIIFFDRQKPEAQRNTLQNLWVRAVFMTL